ncbi:hypothetical protein HOK68_01370, partial [Candidatus Woesearchaeota archaeon]|nr:hypothetical protein [Candidatus Woesearchaeota archaeon]
MVQQQFNYLHLASVAYKHSLYGKVGTYSSNLFEGALWLNKENGGSVNVIEPQAEIQLESSDPFDPKTTIGKTERVYIQDKRLAYESKRLLESNFGQYTGNVDCLLRVIFDKKPILSPTESIFKKDSDYGRTPLEFRPLVNLEHLDEEETRKLIFFGGGDVLKSNEFFNNNLNLETLMNYYQFGHSHLFAESASIYAFTNFVIPFNEIFKVYNSNNKEVGLLTNDWRMVEHEIKEYISVISESIEISKKMDANDFLKYLNRTNYNEKNNFKINVFSTIKNMSTKEEIEYEIKKHLIHEYLSSNKLIQMSDDLLDRDLFSRIN